MNILDPNGSTVCLRSSATEWVPVIKSNENILSAVLNIYSVPEMIWFENLKPVFDLHMGIEPSPFIDTIQQVSPVAALYLYSMCPLLSEISDGIWTSCPI